MKRLDGHLSIGRVVSNGVEDYIEIRIEDVNAAAIVVRATINLADFAKVITAFPQPCLLEFNDSDKIGKTREHKTEAIEAPSDVYMMSDESLHEHLSSFEVDGWVGRISDLKNPNKRFDGKNSVLFERWV